MAITAVPDSDSPTSDPFLGTPYRPESRLRPGGMGELFVARHLELGRKFVVKLLHARYASDPQLVDRVRVEAQSLGRLNHPNIVSVVGFGHSRDGRPYIAMEYLRGKTLTEELGERRLTASEAVGYARQLLSALSAAHALGIVHRDIKPDNLMLSDGPDGRLLKVLDFGVARVLPGVSSAAPLPLSFPTDTGVVVGTPRYVSPEAALGKQVDQRADLYSAGLVLFTMLAGRGPFDHLGAQDKLLSAQASESPEPASKYAAEPIPPELDEVVGKALSKSPEARFQSAEEFEQALARVEPLLGRAHSWEPTVAPPARIVALEPVPPAARARTAGTRALLGVFALVSLLTTGIVAAMVGALMRNP